MLEVRMPDANEEKQAMKFVLFILILHFAAAFIHNAVIAVQVRVTPALPVRRMLSRSRIVS